MPLNHRNVRNVRSLLTAGAAAAMLGCGGGSDGGPTPPNTTVASVTIHPGDITLQVNDHANLTAELKDASGDPVTGASVTWASRSPGVATVAGGAVTAVAVGSSVVVATSGNKADSVVVRVIDDLVLTVLPESAFVQVGETQQFTVEARDGHGNIVPTPPVTWNSSDTLVGVIDENGLATGRSPGRTTITASTEHVTSFPATLVVLGQALACDGIELQKAFDATLGYDYQVNANTEAGSTIDAKYHASLTATLALDTLTLVTRHLVWSGPLEGNASQHETKTDPPPASTVETMDGEGPMVPVAGSPPLMTLFVDLDSCTYRLTAGTALSITHVFLGSSTTQDTPSAIVQAANNIPLGNWKLSGISEPSDTFSGHSLVWAALHLDMNAFSPLGLAALLLQGSDQEPAVGDGHVTYLLTRTTP